MDIIQLLELHNIPFHGVDKGTTGGGKLNIIPYALNTTITNQKEWDLPKNSFDKMTDSIIVFHNTVYLQPSSYTITGDVGTGYKLIIPDNPFDNINDNNIAVIIFRNSVDVNELISGTQLTDGSISLEKLGQDVQNFIKKDYKIISPMLATALDKAYPEGVSYFETTDNSWITLLTNYGFETYAGDIIVVETFKVGTKVYQEVKHMNLAGMLYHKYTRASSSRGWTSLQITTPKYEFKRITPTSPTSSPNSESFMDGVTVFMTFTTNEYVDRWMTSLGLSYPSDGDCVIVETKKNFSIYFKNNPLKVVQEVLVMTGNTIRNRYIRANISGSAWGDWKQVTQDIVNDLVTGGSNKIASAETVKMLKTEVDNHKSVIASQDTLGHFKPDGVTITVDPVTGVAKVVGGGSKVLTFSTANRTMYVNPTTGDDSASNTGLVGKPFKTISRAISEIPDVVNHKFSIITTGTILESIVLTNKSGIGSITIGDASGGEIRTTITNVEITNCSLEVNINSVISTSIYNGFSVSKCSKVLFNNIQAPNGNSSSSIGVWVEASNYVSIVSARFDNKGACIFSESGSNVFCQSISGSNIGGFVYRAQTLGRIYYSANTATGSGLETVVLGGIITK